MAIVFGAHPGGKNAFALTTLFYQGRLPASLVVARSVSSVEEAKNHVIGVVGEWGEVGVLAMNAPLSWSGTLGGWRDCDLALKKKLPEWAPRTWYRSPNALPGAQGVQGPALAWALADEVRRHQLPQHQLIETHAKLSLTHVAKDRKDDLLKLWGRSSKEARLGHVERLVEHFIDAGIIRLEVTEPPRSVEMLESLVAAVTALAVAAPDTGLVTQTLEGGELRPAGKRQVVVLEALP
jgi:hypothetical protein